MQYPSERDAGNRDTVCLGDIAHDVDAIEGSILVDRRKVKARAT